MPLDEKLREVQAWLIKSLRDLEAAKRLLAGDDPLCDVVVYHCQQAAEKALKGYLTLRDSPFSKTHALVQLIVQAERHDEDFAGLLSQAEDLSPFAWRFRYPGDLLDPGIDETEKAVEMAREVVDFVLERLPEDHRPSPGGTTPG